MKQSVVMLVVSLLATSILAADTELPAEIAVLLKAAGAVSYSHKEAYGGGVDDMYIGYDKDSKPVVGIAGKKTKTYKEATAIISVVPSEGKYKISAAEIPDIETFHGKSKDLAKNALKDITGKIIGTEKDAKGIFDGITGATKYLQAIYLSYSVMASKVIKELDAKPAWKITALPTDQ